MKRSKKTRDNVKVKVVTQKKAEQQEKKNTASPEKGFGILTLSILIVIIGFFAFSKYLTGEYLFFFKDIGSDSINQNYPAIVHKINLLKEGFFSEWSFYKGLGDKHITGIASEPYGLIRQLIDYVGGSSGGANFFVFGKFLRIFIYYFLFTGIISYLYFRTLSVKKFSALIGSLLIVFSGYMVVGAGWGFSSHVFKAMFLLFAFEQLYLKKRWYFFPFAVIWLSSNPFVLFIYTVFLFFYSLFRYFSEENKISNYLKLAGKMILLGFVGLLINITTLLKAFLKMYYSPRVAGDASYSNLLSSGQDITEHGNLGATTILRFFSSDILGTGSNFQGWFNYLEAPLFYIGLLTLLLFPQIFIHLNKRKKIIFGSFLGFWLLTLFFPYLRYAILAFTGDYFRLGFDFFIPFTLLLFAVFSLNELEKKLKLNYKLLAATSLLLLIALFFPYKSIPATAINNTLRLSIVIFLALYFVLLFLMTKQKYKSYAQILLLITIVTELSFFSYTSYAGRVPVTKTEFNKDKAGYADGSIKAVNYIKSIDKTPFFRTEKDYQSGNAIHGSLNDALAQGYYGTTSYSSFNQLNYVRFLEKTGLIQKGDETATRWITGLRGYPLLQTFANVKYNLSKSEHPEFIRFGFDSIADKSGIKILRNRFYVPFGYTYDKYFTADDFKSLMNYQISLQSLNLIYQELSMSANAQTVNTIIEQLKPLLRQKFPDLQSFENIIENKIGIDYFEKYHLTITKHSVNNFKNQLALLSSFVYEKDFNNKIDLSEFKQITPNDTNIIVRPEQFNFDIYKQKTNKLKEDTLQITSFKQSEISGKINLSKTKLLFFTIPFDKGWKIKVDGKKETLQRVNFGFTGIVLPKGKHQIELFYIPQYYVISNIISLLSVIIFWLYLGYFFLKKQKSKRL